MYADNDPRFSPLWEGRRDPFQTFQNTMRELGAAYDLRDGRSSDPLSRVSLSVDDWNGHPIVSAVRFPVAAFDDVLFAVQQLRSLRRTENRRRGWIDQADADRRAAVRERWEARGADMAAFRAELRSQYAEAARLTDQPDWT
ncbi:hypothetical protein ADL27_53270 [Streptomyces sp. NRRL F-6602]|nr:hypothetical protein ADL27_53270 [Streptomyces sp. NRRL F-6602]